MKKVVLFGGGTGLSTLLSSAKKLKAKLTIGVAITDNGGSTGKIREYYNIPAPGDLRRVVLELSKNNKIKDLYNYRFDENIEKHTLGNLLLTALTDIEGNMDKAVQRYARLLDVKQKVHPITNDSVHLCAVMENGVIISGEVEMVEDSHQIKKVYYDEKVNITTSIIKAIKKADMIIFSCGSLYTSLLPNIIHEDVIRALKNSMARKVYIANLMTQKGETDNFKLSDHIKAIEKHTYPNIISDVLVNNNYKVNQELLNKYHQEGSYFVQIDQENLDSKLNIIKDNFIIEDKYIRHNTEKLKKEIEKLLMK